MGVDYLGIIREMRRRGVEIDAQSKSARELTALAYQAQVDYLRQMAKSEAVGQTDQAKVDIERFQKESASWGGKAYGFGGFFTKCSGALTLPYLSFPSRHYRCQPG